MKKIHLFILPVLMGLGISAPGARLPQSAADCYTDTWQNGSEQNVVADYGADGSDARPDTAAFQRAIDTLAQKKNGGRLLVPAGTYILGEVNLKSDIHLVFQKGVVLKPAPDTSRMFGIGFKTEQLKNVSFRCPEGRVTVDLQALPHEYRYSPFMISNVRNFMLSDINFLDNYTVFSCLRFVMTRLADGPHYAENGVIRNINLVSGGHIGYGTVQTQFGRNLYFENISGTGGVTLRMESGAGGDIAPLTGTIFDITARDIVCTNGNAAVMISPHARINGSVYVDGVTGVSCASAVRVDQGDTRNGPQPGRYADDCVVRHVTAYYGTTAQIKQGRQHYIPVALRSLLSRKRDIGGKSWIGPACAAVIDTARESTDGRFVVRFEQVQQHGFEHQSKTILTEADRIPFRVK